MIESVSCDAGDVARGPGDDRSALRSASLFPAVAALLLSWQQDWQQQQQPETVIA